MFISMWILLIVIFTALVLLFVAIQYRRYCKFYIGQWEKFEQAYWQLLYSDAVDKEKYDIHLPWLPRGVDACITKKTNNK